MEISEYDFEKICRICKQKSEVMRSIFENDCPRIDEMLMACTTIAVDFGDGLPELVCNECCEQLQNAYRFKQLCEATDVCLREYLEAKVPKNKECPKIEFNSSQNEVTDINSISESISDLNEIDFDPVEDGEITDCVKREPHGDNLTSCDYIQLLENNQLLVICRICAKCFTTLDGLKCHKRIHTGGLFKCNTCGKEYTRHNHLQRHELTHGRRKVHVCKICNKTLTRFEHLKRHLVTHLKEKPYSCTTCNRGFNRAEHLANHANRCKGDFIHVCDICNKGFNRADSLEVHKHSHDNKLPRLPTLDNLDNIEEHYVEIMYDGPEDSQHVFSDESADEAEHGQLARPELLEPQINIAENIDQNLEQDKLVVVSDIATLDSVLDNDDVYAEEDPIELSEEKNNIAAEIKHYVEEEQYESTGSVESEYLPKKRIKRKRGRPRKNFGYNTTKTLTRARGRPPRKIKTEPNDEDVCELEGEYKCDKPGCLEVFSKSSLLKKHASKHDIKLHTCKTCNKSFARANHLRRHMVSHSEFKPFNCEFCRKRFNRKDHLVQHTKLHIKGEEFECEICKKVFGRADHLAKHKASKHDIGDKIFGEKKYQCNVCLKNFTTVKYRDIHMKAHRGDKSYTCRICLKSFISKSHLTEHIKFHNDHSKKFLCSECGQRFIRNDYLVIHMRRHRGEKPFKCKYCGKGFPRTTDLTVHERYHTGEKTHLCTICGRGFGRAYNLTVHMRTHTGEKPYQCTYCDAAFAQGNDLKAHVRRHTGERFHCEYCSESFLMGYLLTHHKRTVHGLNIVSNIRRLNNVKTQADKDPPLTVPLPPPVVPTSVFSVHFQTQMAVAQLLNHEKCEVEN